MYTLDKVLNLMAEKKVDLVACLLQAVLSHCPTAKLTFISTGTTRKVGRGSCSIPTTGTTRCVF